MDHCLKFKIISSITTFPQKKDSAAAPYLPSISKDNIMLLGYTLTEDSLPTKTQDFISVKKLSNK